MSSTRDNGGRANPSAAAPSAPKPKRRTGPRKLSRRDIIVLAVMAGVPTALHVALVWYPTVSSANISLTDWNGVSPAQYIGFANYIQLFGDPAFHQALLNTLIWLSFFLALPTSAGLALAVVLDRSIAFSRVYQSAFYLPLVVSLAVVGFIWNLMYTPRQGLINNMFGWAETGETVSWLGDPDLALWALLVAASWRHVGYVMVLYLAGLKGVDPHLREAARVDGAGEWTTFRHVTFPSLKNVNVIVLVITVIESLRAFDIIWVTTGGGPGNATDTLATLMFRASIQNYQLGYGAAISMILFLISAGFIITYVYRISKQVEEG